MSDVDIKKIFESLEFLKNQVMEMRAELDEFVGKHELNPEYEERIKELLKEKGTRFKSIEEFEAAFE